MRLGIIGLAQSGKKTLFKLLTGAKAPGAEYPTAVGFVPEPRLDRFACALKPKRTRYAELEWTPFLPLPSEDRARDRWFEEARKLDGLCIVLRQFEDPTVYHELGSVDPGRDLQKIELELAVADLAVIETRLSRLSRETARKTAAERAKQEELLLKMKSELEAGRPLRNMELSKVDEDRLSGLKFLTRKPQLIVLNVDEKLAREAPSLGGLIQGRSAVAVSVKLEAELAELDDPAERAAMASELGLAELGASRICREALKQLDLVTFFTGNREEARAWLIRRGSTALDAAGAVHTDFARGFIRAEQTTVEEFVEAGSEARLRERGKLAVRGKDYVVQDGDILHFLASA